MIAFLGTSALIPLLISEESSETLRTLLREDRRIVISSITPLEITSVLWRLRHGDQIGLAENHAAESAFGELSSSWREIGFSARVAEVALDLFSRCPLRTLDAIQLATVSSLRDVSALLPFVVMDKKLRAAARAEASPSCRSPEFPCSNPR